MRSLSAAQFFVTPAYDSRLTPYVVFTGDIMNEFIVKRSFKGPVATGMAAFAVCFIASLIYWPVWGSVSRYIILSFGAPGLQTVDARTAGKFVQVFAEATFFWMIINAWIWQTLVFGGYGKYALTKRQPAAGIWYTLVGLAVGLAGFMIVTGFTGLWWKPFSLSVLFTPQNAQEVHMAIEGWEASNFYALAVILANIGYVALFHKWPFAGNIKAPWDGVGAMSLSSYFCLLAWFALILPSLLNLSIGGHQVVSKPMGSWPTFVAYAQCFIWCFLIPAEGGENYPDEIICKKTAVDGHDRARHQPRDELRYASAPSGDHSSDEPDAGRPRRCACRFFSPVHRYCNAAVAPCFR